MVKVEDTIEGIVEVKDISGTCRLLRLQRLFLYLISL